MTASFSGNKSIGNAGEYHVLSQLSRRGYIAVKTDDGQTLIDVIATAPDTLETAHIQVKTSGKLARDWMMSVKNETVLPTLWYVVVDMHDEDAMPRCWIFHSSEVGPRLAASHNGCDSTIRKFRPTPVELETRLNDWGRMFRGAPSTVIQ